MLRGSPGTSRTKPVESVAVKIAKEGFSLEHEQALYANPDPRIVRPRCRATLDGAALAPAKPAVAAAKPPKKAATKPMAKTSFFP